MALQLNILGVRYPLDIEDTVWQASGHPAYALCENQPPRLQISTQAVASQRLYLLIHEALHALSYMGHLQFLRELDNQFKDDESNVDALASLFAELLTRNRDVFVPLIETGEWPEEMTCPQ